MLYADDIGRGARVTDRLKTARELTNKLGTAVALFTIDYNDAKADGGILEYGVDSVIEPIVTAALARFEDEVRLDEAKWWQRTHHLTHDESCPFDTTDSPEGDICTCKLNDRKREARERIRTLADRAQQPTSTGETDKA